MKDSLSGVSTAASVSVFQTEDVGSIPTPRSKDRRIGRWALCSSCKIKFASFYRAGNWTRFCSRKCQAEARRKPPKVKIKKPQKPRIRKVCECGSSIPSYKAPKCQKCFLEATRKETVDNYNELSLSESIVGTLGAHRYRRARLHAKILMIDEKRECYICGYSTYVEVAHIRPIHTFPPETKLKEINEKSNLIYLCPNHHKELDLNLICINRYL